MAGYDLSNDPIADVTKMTLFSLDALTRGRNARIRRIGTIVLKRSSSLKKSKSLAVHEQSIIMA